MISSKLINRLTIANGVTLLLSLLLIVYLFFFEPVGAARFVSSHAQMELSAIQTSDASADVKAHAMSMYSIANSGMRASALLSGEVMLVLLFFVLLSILNFIWLRKLRRLSHDA